MLKLGDVLARQGRSHARRQPRRLGHPRERSARRHRAARERVREDRRGLQPHVLVLHDPAVPRQAALARRRTTSCARSSSSSRRACARSTSSRRTRSRTGATSRRTSARRSPSSCARVADVKGVRWVRLFYLYPETIDDALIDLLANHPARRAVRRHAAPARGRRDAQAHAPRPRQGPAEARRRAHARERSRTSSSARRSSSATPARRTRSSTSSASSCSGREFEHVGVFRYSDEETCASSATLDGKVPRTSPRAATAS